MDAELEAAVRAMLDDQLVAEVISALERGAREALMELAAPVGPNALERVSQGASVRYATWGPGAGIASGRTCIRPQQPRRSSIGRLMGRAFFEMEDGLREFAYIPDDLLPRMPRPRGRGRA